MVEEEKISRRTKTSTFIVFLKQFNPYML